MGALAGRRMDSSRCENCLDLANPPVQLLIFRIEMRSDADARARSVIYQEIAAQQLPGDLLRVGDIQGHGPSALLRIPRGLDAESGLVRELDQPLRLAEGFGADSSHADLVDDLVSGLCGVQGGNRGSAVQET